VLAYRIVIGFMWGTSDRESGVLTVPTREVCEAVRDAVEELPPPVHGMLIAEPCREDAADPDSPQDVREPARP
jgi:hypothetical protein